MNPYRSYIICTSPRSGSTLLCRLLAATGVSGNPDSYFHEPVLAAWLADHGLGGDEYADTASALATVFDAAINAGTADTGMFGLRLQGKSLDYFLQQVRHLHPEHANDVARIEVTFGRPLFIHLTRGDKLEQAISFLKARQTGLWHKNADGSELERLSPPAEPVYDRDKIERIRTEFEEMDARWQDWFMRESIVPLTITYDQLSDDPKGVLAEVLNALGCDPTAAQNVPTPTAKLSDATNRDWARRFFADDPALSQGPPSESGA